MWSHTISRKEGPGLSFCLLCCLWVVHCLLTKGIRWPLRASAPGISIRLSLCQLCISSVSEGSDTTFWWSRSLRAPNLCIPRRPNDGRELQWQVDRKIVWPESQSWASAALWRSRGEMVSSGVFYDFWGCVTDKLITLAPRGTWDPGGYETTSAGNPYFYGLSQG